MNTIKTKFHNLKIKLNNHPARLLISMMVAFILGCSVYLSKSDIQFTVKDDTRTIVFTYDKNTKPDPTTGYTKPSKVEIKPEQLDKIRTLKFDEALYFCVISFATIGYGDITPVSQEGRIFVTWFALVSILFTLVGIPYMISNWTPKER